MITRGMHLNDKRLHGLADKDNLLFSETIKTATGTNIVITDTKDDAGKITKIEGLSTQPKTYKNEFLNSLFSNTNEWSATYATLSVSNNIMNVTGNGDGVNPIFRQTTMQEGGDASLIIGNKYYCRVNARVTNSDCTEIKMTYSFGASYNYNTIQSAPTANTWYDMSNIITAPATPLWIRFYFYETYATAAIANGKVLQVEKPILVNLTSMFGAGNEPDKTWCDTNITWDKMWALDMPNTVSSVADSGTVIIRSADASSNYVDTTVNIPSGVNMASISTTKDIIENGSLTKNIGKVILNGSEDWYMCGSRKNYMMDLNGLIPFTFLYENGGTVTTNMLIIDLTAGSNASATSIKIQVPKNTTMSYTSKLYSDVENNTISIYIYKEDGATLIQSLENITLTTSSVEYKIENFNTGDESNLIIKYVAGTNTGSVYIIDKQLEIGSISTVYQKFRPAFTLNISKPSTEIRSNKFYYRPYNYLNEASECITVDNAGRIAIKINDYKAKTLQDFKLSWLPSNNVDLYYELPEADVSSINIPEIPTYITSNTITTTNTIKPNLEVQYYEVQV